MTSKKVSMRNLILITLAVITLAFAGCNGCRNDWKHFQSNTIGLTRKITLYDGNGKAIQSWTTTSKVEYNGPGLYFIDSEGNTTTISGTFIVTEK